MNDTSTITAELAEHAGKILSAVSAASAVDVVAAFLCSWAAGRDRTTSIVVSCALCF
jgi:hypothetical protein